ncbi:PD-(D/E)XK nuclease family protein [uncultured Methanobrevibacter sp.]|uniref:RecB family exonuclease n=1 Tax=uncultured Methanobrevibacter sp. TaxID=253161 RepID=UPI0025EB593F|nr:PD-(D/E)XK nuclease family protein [uncultured Methanobrevibacter sp.]MCI6994842.1 PD-(D/E)XK nuclease family protein [Methanobrevibacter sp.]
MKLSKSKVNTYLKCPLEFKFQYIDEIEVPQNKYMALGSDVHLVAEKFAEKFGDDLDDINIDNELLKIAHDEDIGYDLTEHLDNLGSFFKRIFVENKYKLFSQEEYLIDEDHRFSGICDIILEDENGELIVIDYKTSKSSSFSKYRRELCYYKLLVENVYGKTVSQVGVYFTKNDKLRLLEICDEENKRKYLNDDEIKEAVETMYKVRREINNENFPAKRQYLCRFCTYRHICKGY